MYSIMHCTHYNMQCMQCLVYTIYSYMYYNSYKYWIIITDGYGNVPEGPLV